MDAIRKIEAALPDVNYSMLVKHLGTNGANLLSRTFWKDGIDLEVPCEGIQTLCKEYAAQTSASKDAEIARLREALEWYAEIGTSTSSDGLVTIADAGKVARAALKQPTEQP